jgi:hypothetical protein
MFHLMAGLSIVVAYTTIAVPFLQSAWCAEKPLFTTPTDLWVGADGRRDPSGGGLLLYGPTDPGASWYVSQWNNPVDELTGFQLTSNKPNQKIYKAESSAASVAVTKDSNGTSVVISQDGLKMPCKLRSGLPGEFDVLLGMNHRWVNHKINDATLPAPHSSGLDRLSKMASLIQRITVQPIKEWSPYSVARCANNQGNLMVAVVLRDDIALPKQVLYYQLALRTICHNGPGSVAKNFGYRDVLGSFGKTMVPLLVKTRFEINLLPVLTKLLTAAGNGLDTNLANWRVMSGYFGQNIWGNVGMESSWSDYKLSITP